MSDDPRRSLPSVSALLESDALRAMLAESPRALVVDAVRDAVDRARLDPAKAPRDASAWRDVVALALEERSRASLRPVFNATGVVLHTNLGRAPLATVALDAIRVVAQGFANLEYDLERGERGSRYVHCASLLRELTGAEDALVVNNGAAALVLALNTFAEAREAIVSRGELVEIGGSFRVPDIMAKSGATLIEVGSTNRTHADDYARALTLKTGALVKVHRSNFAMEGFVAEVDVRALATLGRARGVPLLYDLGSGLIAPLDAYGLSGEPVAGDVVRDGATIVTMSGDKLLGGPQAGIILGTADAIARMRKNPLTRAFRVDKMTLAALEATLALYREPERAVREIPALAMLAATRGELRARAARMAETLCARGVRCAVVDSEGSVGGGAFPSAKLPSAALALNGDPAALDAQLRGGRPPVIGRISADTFLLDLRSVPATDDDRLVTVVAGALA
ncbi:MAG: L-seryl-tRNA(Sec) selenium transferase [Gemmatimonadota bacterium]|nr:L-seryl-tRNA(Sec) selenium transferase [Gemmatimonadota bacterium]